MDVATITSSTGWEFLELDLTVKPMPSLGNNVLATL